MTERATADGDLSPAEAFELLASEVRVDVLRALATADHGRAPPGEPRDLAFSELYERVDADSTATFAYHLDRLDGAFVTATDGGYRLTGTGERVSRAILAGTYNERPALAPTAVPGACVACDHRTLEASFDGEMLVVRCARCDQRVVTEALLPGQVKGRSPEAVLESAATRIRTESRMAAEGVCPRCGGRIETDVEHVERHGGAVVAAMECRECDRAVSLPVELTLVDHPAVVAFHWRHGVDVAAEPLWEQLARLADHWEREPAGEDAWRVRLGCGGDELRLTVHGDLSVTDVAELRSDSEDGARRSPAPTSRDAD